MSASATADPVRMEVEDTLHRVFDGLVAIPCGALRRAKRAADRSVDRVSGALATPVGLVRSMFELTVNGLLGGGTTASPAAAPAQAADPSRSVPVTESPGSPASAVLDGDPDDATVELPLHGYESLAASQVVARLSRLERDELELIRAFELAHRGRRTILGKIDQLLAGA